MADLDLLGRRMVPRGRSHRDTGPLRARSRLAKEHGGMHSWLASERRDHRLGVERPIPRPGEAEGLCTGREAGCEDKGCWQAPPRVHSQRELGQQGQAANTY